MHGPNWDGFLNVSIIEISTLQQMEAWVQVPKGMNVLPSTSAFKTARFPDGGLVRKLEARFCVHCNKQIEGVDFFNTFAPVVVQWPIVCLLLLLSLTLDLATTKQVNYVSAFCQAPIDEDMVWNHPLDGED